MLFDPDFVPFEPPRQPLGLSGLPTLWRNYIETIPLSAYEQGLTRVKTRWSDVLLVCEPEIIGQILVEKADAFGRDPATRRSFKPTVGENSIFVAEGAEWRWQRRAVAPIFRHETILSCVPVFAAMARRQIERWRAAEAGRPVDAAAAMTRTTFDIIVETMFAGTKSWCPSCPRSSHGSARSTLEFRICGTRSQKRSPITIVPRCTICAGRVQSGARSTRSR